jgi:exopolysaccharide biosynthesis polyprenyl glycosylphosphotransferase
VITDSHPEIPVIGTPESIDAAITATGAGAVLIAFSPVKDELLLRVVRVAHRHKARVWVVPRMFDAVGERAGVEHLGGLPLLALPNADPHGWQFKLKHFIDRVVAGLGLLAISPLLFLLIVLVRLSSPGPIFFGQERIGRDGKVFRCLKFRSMRPPRESDADFTLTSSSAPGGVEGVDRRTTIGKIMRSTSMDELPQLINVLKGEMSLVGPRPERPEFVEFFEIQIHRYGERHRVKAGMTGWAQVHGLRGQTSIADRVEWDNYYIENWSLALDLKILALTVKAVLAGAE